MNARTLCGSWVKSLFLMFAMLLLLHTYVLGGLSGTPFGGLDLPEPKVEVQDDLQRVAAAQVGQWSRSLLEAGSTLKSPPRSSYPANVKPNWGEDLRILAGPPLKNALKPSSRQTFDAASRSPVYATSPLRASTCRRVLMTSQGVSLFRWLDRPDQGGGQSRGPSAYLALDLETDLDNLQGVREDDLTATRRTTCQ
ncbi:hypothetical protein KC363_g110 [Hortaea werneckii]|nr:hypothetical protein KC363_g110 [Hortaea werneckii]